MFENVQNIRQSHNKIHLGSHEKPESGFDSNRKKKNKKNTHTHTHTHTDELPSLSQILLSNLFAWDYNIK